MASRAQPNELGKDVQNVVSEAQELLKTVKDEGAMQVDNMKSRMHSQYSAARERFGEIQHTVTDGARMAANTTDEYVHTNPWQAVGIAAGVGVLLGMLIARR